MDLGSDSLDGARSADEAVTFPKADRPEQDDAWRTSSPGVLTLGNGDLTPAYAIQMDDLSRCPSRSRFGAQH